MVSGHRAIGVLAPQLSGDYFGTLFTAIHSVNLATRSTPDCDRRIATAYLWYPACHVSDRWLDRD